MPHRPRWRHLQKLTVGPEWSSRYFLGVGSNGRPLREPRPAKAAENLIISTKLHPLNGAENDDDR